MADKKISALTGASTPLAGTEILPIVQSGATVKVAVSDLTAGRPVSATVLTSTIAIGTAPLVVTSTTNVANLNASSLNGATFATPGAIGSTTASTGKFSTVETTGKVGIGAGVQSTIQFYVAAGGTDLIFDFGGTGGDVMYSGAANAGITAGENAGASILFLRKNTATSRSINAAGTINAAGLDYAEYMEKSGDFTIAKGDICGIDANGKLTNVFADAVSFVVKSTNPSYVGGDTWGSEKSLGLTKPMWPEDDATDEEKAQYATEKAAFDATLEAARQNVDRIAFCGQVPVNVTGATAGQYIIPVNDNGAIKGEVVSNPTFEQYQQAVGKVISVTNDTPTIIVKIA
jgi:hypothetical protein